MARSRSQRATQAPARPPARKRSRNPSAATQEPRETHLRILAAIRRIPRGRVMTYGEVARRAGLPGRARLVGFVLRSCPLAEDVPWHRVVAAGLRIATRGDQSMLEQRRRLLAEGIEFIADFRIASLG